MTSRNPGRVQPVWFAASVQRALTLAALASAIALAFGWVAIVKVQGPVAGEVSVALKTRQSGDLRASLTRTGYASQGTQVEVMLASPTFFRLTNRGQEAASLGADRMLVFVTNETVHSGDLPAQFAPVLRVDGDQFYVPSEVRTLTDAVHHRATVVTFADLPATSLDQAHTLELLLPPRENGGRDVLTWATPIAYPQSAASSQGISLGLLLSLTVGLLAAISPCLLQLTAFYLPTLTGVSVDQGGTRSLSGVDRGRVIRTALVFVAGFTIPYTIGGALIGGMGQLLAERGVLNPKGPLVVVAGLMMILMAVIIAYRAHAPLACRLPMPRLIQAGRRTPAIGTFVSGFAIATGCVACFGGAIMGVILTYTGLAGSASLGALGMFLFSMGVAIPFLLAAIGVSWVMTATVKLQGLAPMIGFVSSGVMLVFGVIMASGNFHVVSGWLRTLALF